MKKILVTGGSGRVGRFIVEDLVARGCEVTIASRNAPQADLFSGAVNHVTFALDPAAEFDALVDGFHGLVHAAFSHVPGHYRGGEGDDVAGFWQSNYLATVRLFQAAAKANLRRGVFLSSRAVYDAQPPGREVDEETPCYPNTHYGAVKLACERHLAQLSSKGALAITSLRATGVYGSVKPGDEHKWTGLFADYLSGKSVGPRCGTEVHGRDLASAVWLMLDVPREKVAGQAFNVSDILLDRRDLLALVQRHTGSTHPLPNAADLQRCNVASTNKLQALGWRPGGMTLLQSEIAGLIG
jgi:nucleoside-diphosphate-sugar epimerase